MVPLKYPDDSVGIDMNGSIHCGPQITLTVFNCCFATLNSKCLPVLLDRDGDGDGAEAGQVIGEVIGIEG